MGGIKWESNVVMLPTYGQFEPEYVRINNRCVVPCLVEDGRVTTDSNNIIEMLDREYQTISLTPSDPNEREMMDIWAANAEKLFVEAITYSPMTFGDGPDYRPIFMRKMGKGSHEHRIKYIEQLAEKHADDKELHTAYVEMIRLKKLANETMYDQETMKKIIEEAKSMLKDLHTQLCTGPFSKGE